MNSPLRVLVVEDAANDAAQILRELQRAGYEVLSEHVDTTVAMRAALQRRPWDAVIAGSVAALTASPAERQQAEAAMRKSCDNLERKIRERTAELNQANERLVLEIAERKRAEEAVRQSEARFRMLVEGVKDYAIIMLDPEGKVLSWNAGVERIKGYSAEEVIGEHCSRFYTDEDIKLGKPVYALKIAEKDGRFEDEGWRVRKDGQRYWANIVLAAVRDISGQLRGFSQVTRDITEHMQTEQALHESEAIYRSVVTAMAEGIVILNSDGKVTACNESAVRILGYPAEQLKAFPCFDPQHWLTIKEDGSTFPNEMNPGLLTLRTGQPQSNVVMGVHRPDGALAWISINTQPLFREGKRSPHSVLCSFSDITDRKLAKEHLNFLAIHDSLTSLPNRALLQERLTHTLARAQRQSTRSAILFIDLDRFKNINDTLGHHTGDRLLQEVAGRLTECLRESDTVARQGGDEFVILIDTFTDIRDLSAIAQKILTAIAKPFRLDGHELYIGASIGISTYPGDSANMHALLKNADVAMYRAKEQGRNNYQFYSADMNVHHVERLALESGLRRAVEQKEFLLHYHPKIDLRTGLITGMEALIRWGRQEHGMISPAQFIPLAEETGLIMSIGEWALASACKQNKTWQQAGLPPMRVAVNLSARQFLDEKLPKKVAAILAETQLDPLYLELEITESMVMQNAENAVRTLQALKAMGISLAIDDFGTGYSSLGYLKRFPIDILKIDRSFIQELPSNADDAAITQAVIAMAHSLKIEVLAEGVETQEQLDFLRANNCDYLQGFLYSQPLPDWDFAKLLKEGRRLPS